MRPTTQFTRSGRVRLAYQVFGERGVGRSDPVVRVPTREEDVAVTHAAIMPQGVARPTGAAPVSHS